MLTDEQQQELAEMRKNTKVVWHDGEKDVKEVLLNYIIARAYKKHGIKLEKAVS